VANAFIKATKVADTMLGVLERELVLPRLVWRDAILDFTGAFGDTVSIRLPAYTTARTRVMRSATQLTVDDLSETKVDVTLDTHVYKAIGVTDEELTLDIVDFGRQVISPSMNAVGRGMEDALVAEIAAATYATVVTGFGTDPGLAILNARKALNLANVPMDGRVLAVGADMELKLLDEDKFVKVNEAGSDDALRRAVIGNIYGFDVVSVPALSPTEAYAFHKTAFPLVAAAPAVPEGAGWGARRSFNGLTLRTLRDYDFLNVRDRLLTDVFIGTSTVPDQGYYDAQGRWQPFTGTAGASITITTSAAADDIVDTTTAHNFVAGDRVVFTALTGGTGLTTNREYYVIATSLAAQTFRVSDTVGGAGINFTTDITAGTVRKDGTSLLVRAVKLTYA
jgi:hypothetical protein